MKVAGCYKRKLKLFIKSKRIFPQNAGNAFYVQEAQIYKTFLEELTTDPLEFCTCSNNVVLSH